LVRASDRGANLNQIDQLDRDASLQVQRVIVLVSLSDLTPDA
jgi:hypothetical protein